MNRKTMYIFILLILFLYAPYITASAEEKYSPYPIVFVHGLGGSYIGTWGNISHYFQQNYFEGKYLIDDYSYLFPPCDYSPANMDLLDYPVAKLKTAIDQGINKGFPLDYEGERKVIIVAHSMGGLVVQAFLKQHSGYQNKISRVLFAGTPHKGSPLASAYSLVNEEAKKIDKRIEVDSKYAENVLGHLHSEQYATYQALLGNMKLNSNFDRFLINEIKGWFTINPDDDALKQLRVPADISSQITITDGRTQSLATETITVGHKANGDNKNGQSDTKIITYDGLAALAIPEHFSTLKGTGGTIVGKLAKTASGLQLSRTYLGFPSGNALSDLSAGDGVVTQYSQTALPGSSNTIPKYVWHLSEPNEKQAILNALDDSPVIENMRVLSANRYANGPGYFVYVITRVKDYLLADIEIASMTVDGNSVDLSAFYDNGHYKPYKKFGKNMLKERPDSSVLDKDGNVVTIKPGEFYVRLYLEGNDQHVVNIDLKNPSDNPHATVSLTIQRPIIDNESPTGTITNTRPAIEAQIQSPLGIDIYPSSLVMKINGSVVSHTTSGSGSGINIHYTPGNDLDDGQYTVTVDGKDINGIPAEQKEWAFTIQTQRPIITNEAPKGDIINAMPTISARIYSPAGVSINLSSLNMKLDGYTVSHSTSGSGSDITASYIPPSDLTSTIHTVHLYGQDINGLSASKTWTFVIKPGYFIVEIPAKISIGQDFTMKVTACNGLGQAMDGQDGRELYNEGADITISGSPAPQGSLTVTHINSGGWVNGVWQISNQRYTNSTENKYKLTVTVTDAGGTHAGMTGQAETIVSPLELSIRVVGGWFVDLETGNWQDFSENATVYNNILFCQDYYSTLTKRYGGIECLYKIEIPTGSHINNIDIALRIYPYNGHDFPGSGVCKEILYARYGAIPPIPSDIDVEIDIDYSFNFPLSPVGEHNLIHKIIGDGKWSGSVYYRPWGGSKVATYIPPGTIIKTIPITDENIQTVWVSVYTVNMQSAAEQFEAGSCAYNHDDEGNIIAMTEYYIEGIYGYNE